MEKDNLRNRKRHSLGFMRTRLVLLDFVLGNQDLAYFETEQEKVNFFCQELGISKEYLPATVYEGAAPDQKTIRYFVDKFPLFAAPPFPGLPPVVTFSYVDAGFERPSQFASHLAAYQPLFRQLNGLRFLYIATQEAYFHGIGSVSSPSSGDRWNLMYRAKSFGISGSAGSGTTTNTSFRSRRILSSSRTHGNAFGLRTSSAFTNHGAPASLLSRNCGRKSRSGRPSPPSFLTRIWFAEIAPFDRRCWPR